MAPLLGVVGIDKVQDPISRDQDIIKKDGKLEEEGISIRYDPDNPPPGVRYEVACLWWPQPTEQCSEEA